MKPNSYDVNQFVRFLSRKESYPFEVESVEHIETHISHVFLAGAYAFKLKKPVKLSFLDFSSLEKRQFCIEEELRLNRRYAQDLYLGIDYLAQSHESLIWTERREGSEPLLRMRRFESSDLFSNLLEAEKLEDAHLSQAIERISAFHRTEEVTSEFFSFENFHQHLLQCIDELPEESSLELDQQTLLAELYRQKELIEARRSTHVKHLHGDLHLKNICLYEGQAYPFDGIEFGKEYACTDTFCDLAFLLMDLWYRKRGDLAWHTLNRYLELSTDYEGMKLLPIFTLYRALVRAKVSHVRYRQLTEKRDLLSTKLHTSLALNALKERIPTLLIVGGLSGSGKTYLSSQLARELGYVHLRSDVFRKQLAGRKPEEKLAIASYTAERSELVYSSLYETAEELLEEGWAVIIDAVHGDEHSRALANELSEKVPNNSSLLWCNVPIEVARERIAGRRGDASDAGLEVLEEQSRKIEPPKAPWANIDSSKTLSSLELGLKPHSWRTL